MGKKHETKFRTLDDQLIIMADAIRTLQVLAKQQNTAIRIITKMLEDQFSAHAPL